MERGRALTQVRLHVQVGHRVAAPRRDRVAACVRHALDPVLDLVEHQGMRLDQIHFDPIHMIIKRKREGER